MEKFIEFFKADRFAANAGVELMEVTPGYAKAVNKGYIDEKYRAIAIKAFDGLKKTLLKELPDGTLSLTRCCQVGGLGGDPYRDGSFEYYIGEKMRDNDAKATGPFIMGLLELGK